MEIHKLLQLTNDEVSKLELIEQLRYWTMKYEYSLITLRDIVDAEKNRVVKEGAE